MIRECDQIKCGFHKSRGELQASLCPICDECGSPSNIVEDDTCVNCWNCLKDEGYIRKGEPKGVFEEQKNKPKKVIVFEKEN